jgi:hypothetical protein
MGTSLGVRQCGPAGAAPLKGQGMRAPDLSDRLADNLLEGRHVGVQ